MGKINAVITGVGGYVPDYILNNEELSRMVALLDEPLPFCISGFIIFQNLLNYQIRKVPLSSPTFSARPGQRI